MAVVGGISFSIALGVFTPSKQRGLGKMQVNWALGSQDGFVDENLLFTMVQVPEFSYLVLDFV